MMIHNVLANKMIDFRVIPECFTVHPRLLKVGNQGGDIAEMIIEPTIEDFAIGLWQRYRYAPR
jgi:hypothetical protein